MKAAIPLFLFAFAASGCATLGATPGGSGSGATFDHSAVSASPTMSNPFPPQDTNSMPRLIIPATGGPPVIGIPIGGDLFLPVTGGPPVPGIPTSP
jgi:hypothetical protein